MSSAKRFDGYSIFLHMALVGLAVLSLFLINQNRKLQQPPPPRASQLEPGTELPPLAVVDLENKGDTLQWAGTDRESLLLVFTTTCPACQENQKAWRSLYGQLEERVDIVGISLSDPDSTKAYLKTHELPFPVVMPADSKTFTSAFEISAVPTTIRIGRDGRAQESWLGLLTEQSIKDLETGI